MALSQTLGTDLNALAKQLQSKGRGKDTILAHINPKEAMRLKLAGGRGSINPHTGLLEFDDVPPPIEQVNVSAPVAEPNIQAPPPAPPSPPVEQVTSTATAQPQSTLDFSYFPGMPAAPTAVAPSVAAPTAAPAAAPAQVAPAAVTQPSPVPTPTARPDFGAAPSPAPDTSTDTSGGGVGDFLNNNKTLLELGGLGALGLYGGINNARAAGQGAQLQQNLSSIAAPISAQGNAALAGVQTGALTPANEQAIEAVRAQTSAGQRSGAVSSQQAAEAVSGAFATLLNNQLNQALQILNTADTYLQQAYLQGYQANIANQTNTQNFYTGLAQLAAEMAGVGGNKTTITLPAGSTVG